MINTDRAKPSPLFDSSKFNVLYSGNIGAKQDGIFHWLCECMSRNESRSDLFDWRRKTKRVVESLKPKLQILSASSLRRIKWFVVHAGACAFQKNAVVDTVMPSKYLEWWQVLNHQLLLEMKYSEVRHNLEISEGDFIFIKTQTSWNNGSSKN
jgi:colanic acid biosynthesis glycosyl transferase WcaI